MKNYKVDYQEYEYLYQALDNIEVLLKYNINEIKFVDNKLNKTVIINNVEDFKKLQEEYNK